MISIRDEQPGDEGAIADVTRFAFADHPHSSHTEQFIVAALRRVGAMTISLVAEIRGVDTAQPQGIVGHIAFSPVTIADGSLDWYGLGPVSVAPAFQRRGIGRELIEHGLARLRAMNAAGCVVLGEPDYYSRFGFVREPGLALADVPPEYFLALRIGPLSGQGMVTYHSAFAAME